MPTSVKTSIWLYCASAVLGIFLGPLYPHLTLLAVPALALVGFIVYHIARGRHWARVLLLILTLIVAWRTLYPLGHVERLLKTSLLELILIPMIPLLLQGIAVALLFTTPANQWFGKGRAAVSASRPANSQHHVQAAERRPAPSRANGFQKWLIVPVALLAALFVVDRGCHYMSKAILGQTGDPASGDPQYPRVNPNPRRFIHISGLMATTLPASIDAIYEAGWTTVKPMASKDCSRTIFGYGPVPFKVSVPLKLARTGDRYETTLTVDQYLPGGCGWHFARLGIRALKEPLGSDATFMFARAYNPDDDPMGFVKGDYDGPLDLWCKYSPPSQFDAVISCWSLPQIRSDYPALQSVPAVNDKTEVFVRPDTKSLNVDFHDFSAARSVPPPVKP